MEQKPSILLVDDDIGIVQTLTFILEKNGYAIKSAITGEQGILLVNSQFFNLVLLDINLPDMKGEDLLRHIKNQSPATEVLIITGYASVESAINALNEGAYGYIEKPIDFHKFLPALSKALEKQKLYLEKERVLEELSILNTISSILAQSLILEETIDAVLDIIISLTKGFYGYAFLWEEGQIQPKLVAKSFPKNSTLSQLIPPSIIIEHLLKKGLEVEVKQISIREISGTSHLEGEALLIPIAHKELICGLFIIFSSDFSHIRPSDFQLLSNIAHQCSITLENSRLYKNIQKSEAEFRQLFESAYDGILIIKKDNGLIMDANSRFLNMMNYAKRELMGIKLWELFPEMDREKFEKAIETGLGTNQNQPVEINLTSKLGQIIYSEISFFSLPWGREDKLICIIKDITKKKQLEQSIELRNKALLLSKLEWEQTFDAIQDPIFIFDDQLNITRLNQALCLLTHLTYKDILGKKPQDIVVDHDYREKLLKFIQDPQKYSIRNYIINFMGKEMDVSVFPRFDPKGNLIGGVQIMTDVTEKERLRSMLASFQKQVSHTERLALIGQISAATAHEVNNKISAISIHLQRLAVKLKDQPEYMDFIKKMSAAVDHGSKLLRNMLDFSRKEMAQEEAFSLKSLMAQEDIILLHYLEKKSVKMNVEIPDDLPLIKGSSFQIQQVLSNLYINAADAMPNGGRIDIKADTTKLNNQPFVRIMVSDTGIGIPKDKLNLIFEPFFTTKPEGKGTGLGLYIAKQIVENCGGKIEVESAVGKGTTFTIFLPVKSGDFPPQKSASF